MNDIQSVVICINKANIHGTLIINFDFPLRFINGDFNQFQRAKG